MAYRYYYQKEIFHNGLNKYKIIKASSPYELNQKIAAQSAQWDEQWERKCEIEERRKEKELIIQTNEELQEQANDLTEEAETMQTALDQILLDTLYPLPLDWETLKDKTSYSVPLPKQPIKRKLEVQPKRSDARYNPNVPLFVKMSKKKLAEFEFNNENRFQYELKEWEEEKQNIELKFNQETNEYNKTLEQWKKDEAEYLAN